MRCPILRLGGRSATANCDHRLSVLSHRFGQTHLGVFTSMPSADAIGHGLLQQPSNRYVLYAVLCNVTGDDDTNIAQSQP
jgi:hypothetical protein